jgi:hypothetical protein
MTNYAKSKLTWTGLFLALMLYVAGPLVAWAQSWPEPDGVVVSDGSGQIDAGEINDASRDLQALGVKPFVLFLGDYNGFGNTRDLADAAIAEYGLGGGVSSPDPNLFLVVVALGPRQNLIVYGDALAPVMEQSQGGRSIVDTLRLGTLNPRLASADYTGAFRETFREAARQVSLYRNPPVAPTPQPPLSIDTSGIGSALLWIALGVGVLVALAIGVPLVVRTVRRNQEAAARKRALSEQLSQARNVTADMITNLDLPADPQEQIQYRFLALGLEH